MHTQLHTPGPWDAEGITTLYAAASRADAVTMIEIRANVGESGWETVAFLEDIWPQARHNARLIASSPQLLNTLLNIKRIAGKSGDNDADPCALLDLIAAEAISVLNHASSQEYMTDSKNVFSDFERYRRILREANANNRAAVFDSLAMARITRVTVSFDGEGDSGHIETVAAFRGEGSCELPALIVSLLEAGWDKATPTKRPLQEAVESLCCDFLSQEHGGWENEHGGYGSFVFDVSKRTVALIFQGRYVDIHTSNHTF